MNVQYLNTDYIEVVDTGWRCIVCFEVAQCFCVDVTLCEKHAKEYDLGYGKTILQMKKELHEKR